MIKGHKAMRARGWELLLGLGKRKEGRHGLHVSRVLNRENVVDGVCVGFRRSYVALYRMPRRQVAR